MDNKSSVLENICFEWAEFREDLHQHEHEEAFAPYKKAFDLVSLHRYTLSYISNYQMQMTLSDMIMNARVNEEFMCFIFEGQTVYTLFEDFVHIFFNVGADHFDIGGELLDRSWDIRREKQRLTKESLEGIGDMHSTSYSNRSIA